MGDMADLIIEQNWEPDDSDTHQPVTCKYCGQKYLYWDVIEGKWRLFEGDEPHTCYLIDKPVIWTPKP